MSLINCRECGALFQGIIGGRTCPECIQAEEDAFAIVLAYLRRSNERSIPRIAEDTGIGTEYIVRWLRQKRLHLQVVPGELQCRRCSAPLLEGSFCEKCRLQLAEEVAEQRKLMGHQDPPLIRRRRTIAEIEELSAAAKTERKKSAGMHYRSHTDDG